MMMGLKKMVMGVVAGALMLALTAGLALALNQINCGSGSQNPLTPECFGTDQDDLIEGRDARDIIFANDGDDKVNAQYGEDDVYGETGRDKIEGGGEGPQYGPLEGLDKLYGGSDDDVLQDIRAGRDFDELRGGEGNDRLNAYDSDPLDILNCGPGRDDTAIFDADNIAGSDSVSASCENKVPH
jgi:hypothetical protein